MPSFTRREALLAASSGLSLLAGCLGGERSSQSAPSDSRKHVEYEFERVRSTTDPVLFWTGDRSELSEDDPRLRSGYDFVSRESNFEEYTFASTAAGQRLEHFAAATDFETESVFLYSTGVSECHEITLVTATVDANDGDPHIDFCRSVRSAEVACDPAVTDTVGYVVRLPIDGRDVHSSGTGMSGRCDSPPDPAIFEPTVTIDAEGSE
jgi:hypothetical protein